VLTGAVGHYGNMDGTDVMPLGTALPQPRQLAVYGRAVIFPFISGGNGWHQFQTHAGQSTSAVYASSGWMCSSRMDFNTPSIVKLLRRIVIQHAPLNPGEQIYIEAHVDQDPTRFTTSLGANPATAFTTNSTAGSTATVLALPARTIGYSMYIAIKLSAGTSQATSPVVFYFSVEVSVSWTWKFTLDCSSRRDCSTSRKISRDCGRKTL